MSHMYEKLNIDTKIAFSFYDLGISYEKRKNYNLAIENYVKALDYDNSLKFIKIALNNLHQFIKQNNLSTSNSINMLMN